MWKYKAQKSSTYPKLQVMQPNQDKSPGVLRAPSKPAFQFCVTLFHALLSSTPWDELHCWLTSARRECLWTFSPFCTLGASCCRTPLLLVSALVSRANFPQPEACDKAKHRVNQIPNSSDSYNSQKQTHLDSPKSKSLANTPSKTHCSESTLTCPNLCSNLFCPFTCTSS